MTGSRALLMPARGVTVELHHTHAQRAHSWRPSCAPGASSPSATAASCRRREQAEGEHRRPPDRRPRGIELHESCPWRTEQRIPFGARTQQSPPLAERVRGSKGCGVSKLRGGAPERRPGKLRNRRHEQRRTSRCPTSRPGPACGVGGLSLLHGTPAGAIAATRSSRDGPHDPSICAGTCERVRTQIGTTLEQRRCARLCRPTKKAPHLQGFFE